MINARCGVPKFNKMVGSFQTAQPLQIIAQHNPAHTVTHKIQRLVSSKDSVDKISDLTCQYFQGYPPIAGRKSDGVGAEILVCEESGEVGESRRLIPIARNQYHWIQSVWLIIRILNGHG